MIVPFSYGSRVRDFSRFYKFETLELQRKARGAQSRQPTDPVIVLDTAIGERGEAFQRGCGHYIWDLTVSMLIAVRKSSAVPVPEPSPPFVQSLRRQDIASPIVGRAQIFN